MTNETVPLPNTDLEIAASGYDIGYGTPAKDWQERNVDAFVELFSRLDSAQSLSSFNTLQAAVDWSWTNRKPLTLEEDFVTDETNVRLPRWAVIDGGGPTRMRGGNAPAIISTNTANNDPFISYNEPNMTLGLSGVNFINDGSPRAFFVPGNDPNTWVGFNTDWQNVVIEGFGATGQHPYTVDLKNAWGSSLSNVVVQNHTTTGYGAWRLTNCNAANFEQLSAYNVTPQDGETPAVYVYNCHALHLESPHIEHFQTDAALQITRGNVTVSNLYTEPQSDGWANVALQVGDGSISPGHTEGVRASDCRVTITEPVAHAFNKSRRHPNPDWINNLRLLNFDHVNLIGGPRRASMSSTEYGGSEYDSAQGRSLVVNPGVFTVTGNTEIDVTNRTNSPASVSIRNGRVFSSESAASSGLVPFEWGWITDGSGLGLVRKAESGTVAVWRPGSGGGGGGDHVEAVRPYLSADQSIPTDTKTKIQMDATVFDSIGFDATNHSVTVTESGLYDLSLSIRLLGGTSNQADVRVEVNGAAVAETGTRGQYGVTEALTELTSGDTIEWFVYQRSGGSRTLNGKQAQTFAEVERVGSL